MMGGETRDEKKTGWGADDTAGKRQSTRSFKRHRAEFFDRCRAEDARCWLCGQPIDYEAEPGSTDDSLTLDHIQPVAKRPDLQEDPANFAPAHRSCNIRRGARDPHEPIGMRTRDWAGESERASPA